MAVRLPPFQALMDEHRDDVYRFLVASLGRHDADDCFQETFIAALRAYPRLRSAKNLRSWLFTIAQGDARHAPRARAPRASRVGGPRAHGLGRAPVRGARAVARAVRYPRGAARAG